MSTTRTVAVFLTVVGAVAARGQTPPRAGAPVPRRPAQFSSAPGAQAASQPRVAIAPPPLPTSPRQSLGAPAHSTATTPHDTQPRPATPPAPIRVDADEVAPFTPVDSPSSTATPQVPSRPVPSDQILPPIVAFAPPGGSDLPAQAPLPPRGPATPRAGEGLPPIGPPSLDAAGPLDFAAPGDARQFEWSAPRPIVSGPGFAAPPPEVISVPHEAPGPPQNAVDATDWWHASVLRPLRDGDSPIVVDANSLVVATLRHSPQVRAISDSALIARTAIVQAKAEFDPRQFLQSKFVRTSVPTGSTLDAGFNVPRLRDNDFGTTAGLRKRTLGGGRVELSQKLGTRDSNSQFFFPANQGNSRLSLSYNQPLLNGAGRCYNTSAIVLAQLDTKAAESQSLADLQQHLLQVAEGLWELYLRRAVQVQRARHAERGLAVLGRLEARRDLDALDSQIAGARAAVAMRRTELLRSQADVQNAEAQLRALVGAPEMLDRPDVEIVPAQPPLTAPFLVSLEDALVTALSNRPELDVAARQIEAARVKLDVARNELQPVLDLVLETYVSGLRQDFNVANAWIDQFGRGEPSYTAGLLYEVPLGRRAAQAQVQRRQLELRQLVHQFQATVQTLHAEVEVAVRTVQTTGRTLQSRREALRAAELHLEYLVRRWELLPGDDRVASALLEELLDAQERLLTEELGLAEAETDYALSVIRLNRATGALLREERIEVHVVEGPLPEVRFERK